MIIFRDHEGAPIPCACCDAVYTPDCPQCDSSALAAQRGEPWSPQDRCEEDHA